MLTRFMVLDCHNYGCCHATWHWFLNSLYHFRRKTYSDFTLTFLLSYTTYGETLNNSLKNFSFTMVAEVKININELYFYIVIVKKLKNKINRTIQLKYHC